MPTPDLPQARDHALVIGGSLAGLLAARVLSDHFDRVTIVERDAVADRPEPRKGQPQTRQFHGLLAAGLDLLTDFFPRLDDDLVEGGAMVRDMGEAMRWYHFGGYRKQFEAGLRGMLVSRPFLEWHIRRRVLALPNVTLRDGHAVGGLEVSAEGQRVTGVAVADRADEDESATIPAALIVDASGRGSRAPAWLEHLGYAPPPEEEVTVKVGYATRYYRRPEGEGADEMVMTAPTPPDEKRMAVLSPIEGDRWIVMAGGWAGDYPPGDEPGFLAFLESLPVTDIHEIVSRAEPLSEIIVHRFPANRRRRYDKLRRFPEGFLVLGDAVASFNPVYGQGMTSAAMQARALDEVLQGGTTPKNLWRRYFRQAGRVVERSWQLAVGEDFRYPETEGRKPPLTDLLNAYVGRVHRATHSDTVVYGQFLQVMNMLAPPTTLMHPRIVLRVLRAS